jgi:hypothetical protein
MNSSVAITSHVAMAMLGVLYVTGLAQAKTVAREDNIWDGKAHQPTRSEVLQRERLSRIAESPQRDKLADLADSDRSGTFIPTGAPGELMDIHAGQQWGCKPGVTSGLRAFRCQDQLGRPGRRMGGSSVSDLPPCPTLIGSCSARREYSTAVDDLF